MADKFQSFSEGLNSPPAHLSNVTPSDATDLPYATRGINVGVSGTLRITTVSGDTGTINVAAGIVFPIRAMRIWNTGTTASSITALY